MRSTSEQKALKQAIEIGLTWGFGNVIDVLKDAWSEELQRKYGWSKEFADEGALHICPWCNVDSRTGKKRKAKRKPAEGRENG